MIPFLKDICQSSTKVGSISMEFILESNKKYHRIFPYTYALLQDALCENAY